MKLRRPEKKTLAALGTVTYVSGATLFVFDRWIRVPSDVGPQHHAAEFWIRVAHSALTYFVIMAIGYLIKGHVIPGFRAKNRRSIPSGTGLLAIFGFLLLTALVILYMGESEWSNAVSLAHALTGLSLPLVLVVHLYKRRRRAH